MVFLSLTLLLLVPLFLFLLLIMLKLRTMRLKLPSENLDKGKSILGAPPKLDKKDIKTPKAKKANSQKPK